MTNVHAGAVYVGRITCSWRWPEAPGCSSASFLGTSDTRSRRCRSWRTDSRCTCRPVGGAQARLAWQRQSVSISESHDGPLTLRRQQQICLNINRVLSSLWCRSAAAWRPSWRGWWQGWSRNSPAGGDRDTGRISWWSHRRSRGNTKRQNSLKEKRQNTQCRWLTRNTHLNCETVVTVNDHLG